MDFSGGVGVGGVGGGVGGVSATLPMNLSFTTKATTGGFVGGADRTYRNFGPGGGTLITGILTGYLSFKSQLIFNEFTRYIASP